MNTQELVEKIKQTPHDKQLELIDSIPIEDCINVMNSDDYIARYYVIGRKYSIDEIEYLSSRIPLSDFMDIIEKLDIKSKNELVSILNMDILNEADKNRIFIDKVFNLSEEDMVSFIDSYATIDEEKLRRIGLSYSLSDSSKEYLIKNSKYGAIFAQYYMANIDYDLSLETNETYNTCLEKIAKSLDTNKEEMKYYISILGQNNPKILHTIDYKMLTSSFRDLYSLNYNKSISNTDRLFYYPKIQHSITKFGDNPVKVEVLKEFFKYVNSNCTDNWEAYVYLITSSFDSNKEFYDSLQLNNAGKVFNDTDIKKLMTYCSIKDRKYQISNITDLINIDKVRSEYIEETFANPSAKSFELKNALLEKKYGINREYAESLVRQFKQSKDFPPDLLEMFNDIDKILKMKNDELREYEKQIQLGDMINIIDLQKLLKNTYEQEYSKELFKPTEKNYVRTDDGVKIYDAGLDFSMIIHSSGGIIQKEGNTSDVDHWNRDPLYLDCFSGSFIRNDLLGYVDVKTVMYGFSNLDNDGLLDMCNLDYGSRPQFANGLSQSVLNNPNSPSMCMSPDDMVKNTSAPNYYNEFVLNRIQNGKARNPDYIVYICDEFEKDIVSNDKLTQSTLSGKDAYQNALRIAKEFGIPIVFAERSKILINEKTKIEKAKQELFNSEGQLDERQIKEYIDDVVTRYRTNFLGMSSHFDTAKITEKYKDTGISIDNYVKDCNAILEYAKYLEAINERLSKVVLESFKDAMRHPPVIFQLDFGIDEKIMQKYTELLNGMNELESNRTR